MMWGEAISPECRGQFSHGEQGLLSCCRVQQGAGPAISGTVRGGANSACPLDFNMQDFYDPLWQHGPWTDTITEPSYSRTTDPDMALGSSSGPDVTMAAQATQTTMALVAAGIRWLSRPWTFAQPLVAIGAMDMNPDPGC